MNWIASPVIVTLGLRHPAIPLSMAPHERLRAWQATHRLVLAWYRVTDAFPIREKYGLTAQIRRSAFSAGANIAEGAAKSSARDFARFLDIALGSLGELEYAQRLATDLAYLGGENLREIGELQSSAGRLTRRLHQAIVTRARGMAPQSQKRCGAIRLPVPSA